MIVLGAIILGIGFYFVIVKEFGNTASPADQARCEANVRSYYHDDPDEIANGLPQCTAANYAMVMDDYVNRASPSETASAAEYQGPTRRTSLLDRLNYAFIGIGAGLLGLGLRGLRNKPS